VTDECFRFPPVRTKLPFIASEIPFPPNIEKDSDVIFMIGEDTLLVIETRDRSENVPRILHSYTF